MRMQSDSSETSFEPSTIAYTLEPEKSLAPSCSLCCVPFFNLKSRVTAGVARP